jgi:aldehyde dehydrogenase (NAD+)
MPPTPTGLTADSLIASDRVPGARAAISENPARPDQPVGRYTALDASGVAQAVAVAGEAAEGWRRRSALDRGRILRRAADVLAGRVEELATLLTAEEGKTLADSRGEINRAVEILEYHASSVWWPSGETFHPSRPGDLVRTARVPLGVVAVITPWNFPASIPVWKIAPALAHGNTVVWKPASATPILSVALAQAFLDAGLDPGVLSVVLGDGDAGEALVGDPRVAAVTFTGSEAVGRHVARRAFDRNAKCQLELGGHNPAIVLADADLDLAVQALVRSIANGTGQKCTATRRIIVERPVHDRLVDALTHRFADLRVGDGMLETTEVGPLVDERARSTVASEIDRALVEGCELIVRTPDVPHDGAFLGPTLLASDDQRPAICREEVFGPVSVVIPARDVDEALALAENSRYGLSASIFTRSERTARRAAEELTIGVLNVNGPSTGSELHAPFGGAKASSAPGPPEQGMAAREFFTDTRTVISTALEH